METLSKAATVTEYLQGDHHRLDGLMEECAWKVASGDVAGAASHFESFRAGLTRHIKIEEGLLFPEFENVTGMSRSAGPTAVMRREHEEILEILGRIGELFRTGPFDASTFQTLRSSLVAVLYQHNVKEEQVLYPTSDQMIPSDRLKKLVETMIRF